MNLRLLDNTPGSAGGPRMTAAAAAAALVFAAGILAFFGCAFRRSSELSREEERAEIKKIIEKYGQKGG